jgi:hypothetical protein
MDISAYVFDISIYGVMGQFVINSSTSIGPPGPTGPDGVFTNASTGYGLYWTGGLLNVSTNYANYAYINASLNARDTSLNNLYNTMATNASVNLAIGGIDFSSYATNSSISLAKFIKETSLGNDFSWVNGLLDVSTSSISSLSSLTDVSIISIGDGQFIQYEASTSKWKNVDSIELNDYFYSKTYIDGSLNAKTDKTYTAKQDVSIGLKTDFTYDVKQDASLVIISTLTYALNSSTLTYTTNSSVNSALLNVIKNASLNQSKFAWNGGYLEPSIASGTGDVTKAYVDGSLGTLNSSVNSAFLTNASLGTLTTKVNYIDSSLGTTSTLVNALNSSMGSGLTSYATNSSVNLALTTNSSLGTLTTKMLIDDASIGNLTTKVNYIDSSLGTTITLVNALNSSMGSGLTSYATNSSVNSALGAYSTNSSIASANFLSTVNASNWYMPINASHYSLSAITSYIVCPSDNNNLILVDTSASTVIFPNTLQLGFQTTVVNNTIGIVTLNASTLYTVDSSVKLTSKYAAASVYCKGTGVFYAFGNLK